MSEENKCYTVVWHSPNPKCYFAGYSLEKAIKLQHKVRAKHAVYAVTIQKEI